MNSGFEFESPKIEILEEEVLNTLESEGIAERAKKRVTRSAGSFGEVSIDNLDTKRKLLESNKVFIEKLRTDESDGAIGYEEWRDKNIARLTLENEKIEHEELSLESQSLRDRWSSMLEKIGSGPVYAYEGEIDPVIMELSRCFMSGDISKKMKDIFSDNSEPPNVSQLYDAVSSGKIPDQVLEAATRQHLLNMEAANKTCQEVFDQAVTDFKKRVLKKVESGEFPEEVIQALRRLPLISLHVRDSLVDMNTNSVGEYHRDDGSMDLHSGTLYVPNREKKLRQTIFHELFHALSGERVVSKKKKLSYGDGRDFFLNDTESSKSGLLTPSLNGWLNEAVTEQLTLELLGDEQGEGDQDRSYIKERKTLMSLLEKGLDKQLVYDAYFENITHSGTQSRKQGEKFASLMHAIREIEGDFGVIKLSREFQLERIVKNYIDSQFFMLEIDNEVLGKRLNKIEPENQKFFRINISFGRFDTDMAKKSYTVLLRADEDGSYDKSIASLQNILKNIEKRTSMFAYEFLENAEV